MHTAAAVRRGDLLLAVSTGGTSPALAARIRRELAERYGAEYGLLLALLKRLRGGAARGLPPERRGLLWRRLTTDEILGWLRAGEIERAEAYAKEQIAELMRET
jgi:siroheme synthase (precorrin-2 oxidase/ferrochelatase)